MSDPVAVTHPSSQPRLRDLWERYAGRIVWLAVAYLVIAAAGRLIYALPYLVTDAAQWSALDFKYRYEEVTRWFAGLPVYEALDRLMYPPASYAVLWPFMGWLPLSAARVVWAVTILVSAAIIAAVAYAVTASHPRRERLVVALLAFAAFPVQIAVLVGQLPVHAVAFAAAAAYFLTRPRPHWATDVAGAALLAASLVKPTLTVPVAAATLIASRRWQPVVLSAACYGALSLIGAAAQPEGIVPLLRAWLHSTSTPELIAEGVPNLHLVLSWVGREAWASKASLVVLAAFAAWTWRHRAADAWVLVAAAALVARLWSYHREYDDVIILLAAIGLMRAARGSDARIRTAAGLLFAATWAALLTPTWAIYNLPAAIVRFIEAGHAILWVTALVYLLSRTQRRPPKAGAEVAAEEPARVALGAAE